MSELEYHVVDVFTDRGFAGNPLAVVLGADGLSGEQMQTLAQEFHLSETAFPLEPSAADRAAGAAYRLRIFTPVVELPFAGHPSVGTAWLLARLGRIPAGQVVQACGAGMLTVNISPGPGQVELTGGMPTCSDPIDPGPLLAAVGLTMDDLTPPPSRIAGTGLGFAYVMVRPDALARCIPDLPALAGFAHPVSAATGVYVVAWDGVAGVGRARMFAGDVGVAEDPATGSAALGLGVWLVASGLLPGDGSSTYTVQQGHEMGRPSRLECAVEAVAGRASSCRVRGQVVAVARGVVAVPV